MAVVVARERKTNEARVYWNGADKWHPSVMLGKRFDNEEAAKEEVADKIKGHDTSGYHYESVQDPIPWDGKMPEK